MDTNSINAYNLSSEEVAKKLGTDIENGLTQQEASERVKRDG
ncbi:MAG: hypothetical protein LBU51_00130, partial [Bacteroidales bacterium]|nr:hypothetical protein [Bacteroidales bacterium]